MKKIGYFALFMLFSFYMNKYDELQPSLLSTGWSGVDYIGSGVFFLARCLYDLIFVLIGQMQYILLFSFAVGVIKAHIKYDFLLAGICLSCLIFHNICDVGVIGGYLYKIRILLGYYSVYEVILIHIPALLFLLCLAWSIDLSALYNNIYKLGKQLIMRKKARAQAVVKVQKPKIKPISIITDSALPALSMIQRYTKTKAQSWNIQARQQQLEQVLLEFGVKGKILKSSVGPVVTLYELQPEPGVKALRIIGLANDIARSMSALSARIAPIPGKDVIGIELSNPHREMVYLYDILSCNEYHQTKDLLIGLGCDITGKPCVVNLATMPHMLMAGTTGSGKSVAIHTIVLSLLFKHTPQTCKLLLIDPKMLELSSYADIPHLITPVVTEPKIAVMALKWAVQEMERRYKLMANAGVRNLDAYNAKMQAQIPYIVVIVDEFADLMLVAGKEIDTAIQRLAQMARAAGLHVILATQRPSVDVITGTIKANFPTRVALQVATKIDARTVLGDHGGAEQLLGKGDMLYLNVGKLQRVHGPFVSSEEVEDVVAFWKQAGKPVYEELYVDDEHSNTSGFEDDPLLEKVWEFIIQSGRVSASSIQREFNIGFNKAAKCLEKYEKMGRVSAQDAMGRRKIL